MQKLQIDKKIKALEEQIELFQSFIHKQEPLLTIEDYRKYLAKTRMAVIESIEPTEYIRSGMDVFVISYTEMGSVLNYVT